MNQDVGSVDTEMASLVLQEEQDTAEITEEVELLRKAVEETSKLCAHESPMSTQMGRVLIAFQYVKAEFDQKLAAIGPLKKAVKKKSKLPNVKL